MSFEYFTYRTLQLNPSKKNPEEQEKGIRLVSTPRIPVAYMDHASRKVVTQKSLEDFSLRSIFYTAPWGQNISRKIKGKVLSSLAIYISYL